MIYPLDFPTKFIDEFSAFSNCTNVLPERRPNLTNFVAPSLLSFKVLASIAIK